MTDSAYSILVFIILSVALVGVIVALGKMARREEEAQRAQRQKAASEHTVELTPESDTDGSTSPAKTNEANTNTTDS